VFSDFRIKVERSREKCRRKNDEEDPVKHSCQNMPLGYLTFS
jgi:hypothetical protein